MQRATVPPGLLLGGVRCEILWASVLLVSAALAYAIDAAITAGVSAGGTHVGGDPAALVAEQSPAEGRTFRLADRHDNDTRFPYGTAILPNG
jgi:hypothetical protein